MSRIAGRFAELKAAGRKALIPYITAGDPQKASTVPLLHGMVEAGSDILEIGVPFSDPMADGPAIQRSSERALKNGIGLADVLNLVVEFRKRDSKTPVVLMGYANPIEAMGVEKFVAAAKAAGVDGAIVVDYPPEECGHRLSLLRVAEGRNRRQVRRCRRGRGPATQAACGLQATHRRRLWHQGR
jgi:tryptophan synthase alpha chain